MYCPILSFPFPSPPLPSPSLPLPLPSPSLLTAEEAQLAAARRAHASAGQPLGSGAGVPQTEVPLQKGADPCRNGRQEEADTHVTITENTHACTQSHSRYTHSHLIFSPVLYASTVCTLSPKPPVHAVNIKLITILYDPASLAFL